MRELLRCSVVSEFCVKFVQIDERYEPASTELRTLFGLQLEQQRNDAIVDNRLFTNVVTARKHVRLCLYFLLILSV